MIRIDYSKLDYSRMAIVPSDVRPFAADSPLASFAYPGYTVVADSATIGQVYQDKDGWHYMTPHGAFGARNTRKEAIAVLVAFGKRNYK